MVTNTKKVSKKGKKSRLKNIIIILIILIFGFFGFFLSYAITNITIQNSDNSCTPEELEESGGLICPRGQDVIHKPVIYLYPIETSDVKVQLDYQGELFADYPQYNEQIGGWKVTAEPNGKLINFADKKEYSYIFWEGIPEEKIDWDFSKGFVVKGEDIVDFFQEKLPELGLTPVEYNEFIVFWYPLMKDNKYNLIHFAEEQYTDHAPLTISPTPDSMLRVFMVYKRLDDYIEVEEQEIKSFERKGFSVVEWGGVEVK